MELIISLLNSEDNIGIIIYDISSSKIVEAISLESLKIDDDDGIRGITYSTGNFYYATTNHVVKADLNFKCPEVIFTGVNIHQIDISEDCCGWMKGDAVMICNTGHNFVLEVSFCDDRVIHIGHDGMRGSLNHISSVFGDSQYNYFVYHNNYISGLVVRNDDKIVLEDMIQPHNVYVCEDRIICCNSLYNEVIIKEDVTDPSLDINDCIEVSGYSRGMAMNVEDYLFVGESELDVPGISVIDIFDKKVIDRYCLESLHQEDSIYDIRIWDSKDLCMTRSNL